MKPTKANLNQKGNEMDISPTLTSLHVQRTWISPLNNQLEKKLNKERRRHPSILWKNCSRHLTQGPYWMASYVHILPCIVLMKPIQQNVNILIVLCIVNDKSSLHMFSTDAILLFKHFSSVRFNQKTWTPWICRTVHPYLPTRQSSEQTAACKPRTPATALTNKGLLRQTGTVLLVWVITFNITHPQNSRPIQAHFSSYCSVKNYSLENSFSLSKCDSLPRLFNSFSLLSTHFIHGPCKSTLSRPPPPPTHTHNASTA